MYVEYILRRNWMANKPSDPHCCQTTAGCAYTGVSVCTVPSIYVPASERSLPPNGIYLGMHSAIYGTVQCLLYICQCQCCITFALFLSMITLPGFFFFLFFPFFFCDFLSETVNGYATYICMHLVRVTRSLLLGGCASRVVWIWIWLSSHHHTQQPSVTSILSSTKNWLLCWLRRRRTVGGDVGVECRLIIYSRRLEMPQVGVDYYYLQLL